MNERLKRRLVGGGVLLVGLWALAFLIPDPPPPGSRDEQQVVIDLRSPEASLERTAPTQGEPTGLQARLEPDLRSASDAITEPRMQGPATGSATQGPAAGPATQGPATGPTLPPQASAPAAATPTPTAPSGPRPTPLVTPPPSVAVAAPSSVPATPSSGWWVQVGAYSAREAAEQVREKLRIADLPAVVQSAQVEGRTIHRVRIGPYPASAPAESAQARAVLLGHTQATIFRQ